MSGVGIPGTSPLITVEGIHTFYGKSHILHGVSLDVGPGEVVGLLVPAELEARLRSQR